MPSHQTIGEAHRQVWKLTSGERAVHGRLELTLAAFGDRLHRDPIFIRSVKLIHDPGHPFQVGTVAHGVPERDNLVGGIRSDARFHLRGFFGWGSWGLPCTSRN